MSGPVLIIDATQTPPVAIAQDGDTAVRVVLDLPALNALRATVEALFVAAHVPAEPEVAEGDLPAVGSFSS